jgi:hypothetical protein
LGHTLNSLGTVAVLAVLAACASSRPVDGVAGASAAGGASTAATAQQRALARYESYADRPVKSFTWLGHFDSWEPLGKDRLLVYTKPNEAYLLKVSGPCDVNSTIGPIGISSTNFTVYQGLDSIVVNSGPGGGGKWQCPIDEIRPLDVRGMKADLQSQGKAQPQR